MSVILVFLLVVLGFAGWWLAHQRLMSKPWLEVGPDPVGGPERTGMPTQKIALGIFLAVVGALFALFASAYFMRMELSDWRPMPLPRIVWLNTGMLVLASVALECALAADRKRDAGTLRLSLVTGAVATLGLPGRPARRLARSRRQRLPRDRQPGQQLLLPAHGAARPAHPRRPRGAGARRPCGLGRRGRGKLRLRLELCVAYWHFLLFVWLGLLVLFAGWATDFIDICRQLLT